MQLAEGKIIADRFKLVRELGVGGMGSVWLAHHVGLDTPCAVKFIHAEVAAQPDVRARFEREAKAAAALRSSHVVQILDYGVWDGQPYIAMEYLEGEDLGERLKRVGRLAPHETVLIVAQVARALTKAHAAGLIHRDLKPENVFLVTEDDHEVAKVLDFGIAKMHQTQMALNTTTKAGSLLGTPHYMSPEQAEGTKKIDYRSDLWSLAVLAYQCVVGQLPFNGEALGELLLQVMTRVLPVPSEMAPDVPAAFDAWWARAAAREPDNRFQSAKELADALAHALGLTAATAPGMTPFTMPTSGVFSLASMLSSPSITPPMIDASRRVLEGSMLGVNVAPTTGQAVSIDGRDDRGGRKKVPLALGVLVGAVALMAGVGIALWGNSQFPAQPAGGVGQAAGTDTTLASASSATPSAETSASPTASASSSATAAASAAPSASPAAIAAPLPPGAGQKLPIKPRKPKEKDFGF